MQPTYTMFELISAILNCILLFFLFAPNIVYLIHRKHFIWKDKDEWGYSTPKQKRYKVGDMVRMIYDMDATVYKIIETGRHDYLICKADGSGDYTIVRQYEIYLVTLIK